MFTPPIHRRQPRGQIVVLFGVVMVLIAFVVGLVIDGGTGLAHRRASQNASDFAALAGARVVAERIGGDTVNGTDANVQAAIANAIAANGGLPVTFGAPDGPQYISDSGVPLGWVGDGIPAGAAGVTLNSSRDWEPLFMGFFGFEEMTSTAAATAKGGFSTADPPPETLFPIGVTLAYVQTYPSCAGPISTNPADPCHPQRLIPGNLNVPGGFGWLKFGCAGFGLGQGGGCDSDPGFLQSEIGPPSNSYGCCTQVGQGGPDRIGSVPATDASADCSYYIDNEITVTVPIWDTAGGTGDGAWHHIVGYAGFQLTQCDGGGQHIEGVWRVPFFTGPVSATPTTPSVPQPLGVQLVR